MARRTKQQKKVGNGASLGFEATIWLAADKLRNNLYAAEPGLILFSFKRTGEALLGEVSPGEGPLLGGVPTFLLTGPYAAAGLTEQNLEALRAMVGGRKSVNAPSQEVSSVRAPPALGAMCTQRVTKVDKLKMRTTLLAAQGKND